MPSLIIRAFAVVLAAAMFGGSSLADDAGITAKLHPWGQFEPGTWKVVRVVTETLDEQGDAVSTSTTDSKTTLMDADEDGVTLEIQACMEVAGKRFQAEPQTVKQDFRGELSGPTLKVKPAADAAVVIEGRSIPCKVQQFELISPREKTSTTLYYTMNAAPHVLKRESVTTDIDGKNSTSDTVVEVTALDMPVRVHDKMRSGAYVKTVQKNAKGTTTTLAVVLADVPGGVVSHSSKEVDKAGRVVRRSTLELIDFNADPEKDRSGIFNRKRPGRRSKPTSRYGT